MFHEGQMVTSIGEDSPAPLGSHGRILALANADAGHVQWLTGGGTGQVDFIRSLSDVLAPANKQVQASYAPREDILDDSLDVGPISRTGTRHLMATGGPGSVLQQLTSMGAFADSVDVAEEAVAFVESRLRHSAGLQSHLADLDEEDREIVLRLASRDLLAQACGGFDE